MSASDRHLNVQKHAKSLKAIEADTATRDDAVHAAYAAGGYPT